MKNNFENKKIDVHCTEVSTQLSQSENLIEGLNYQEFLQNVDGIYSVISNIIDEL